MELTCFNCGTKGHYASDCKKKKTDRKYRSVNIADANMIKIIDSPASFKAKSLSLSEKWNFFERNSVRAASWDKYEKFILNYCIHRESFCDACLTLRQASQKLDVAKNS